MYCTVAVQCNAIQCSFASPGWRPVQYSMHVTIVRIAVSKLDYYTIQSLCSMLGEACRFLLHPALSLRPISKAINEM